MEGLIGKKIGMTQVFDADGKRVCVTVVEVGPCPVVQMKTLEKDGYVAAQLGFGEQKKQRLTKAAVGHQEKTGGLADTKVRVLKEFAPEAGEEVKVGDVVEINLGSKPLRVKVLSIAEAVRKEDASAQYEVLSE